MHLMNKVICFLISIISFSTFSQNVGTEEAVSRLKKITEKISVQNSITNDEINDFLELFSKHGSSYVLSGVEGKQEANLLLFKLINYNPYGFLNVFRTRYYYKNMDSDVIKNVLQVFSNPNDDGDETNAIPIIRKILKLQQQRKVNTKLSSIVIEHLLNGYSYRCN